MWIGYRSLKLLYQIWLVWQYRVKCFPFFTVNSAPCCEPKQSAWMFVLVSWFACVISMVAWESLTGCVLSDFGRLQLRADPSPPWDSRPQSCRDVVQMLIEVEACLGTVLSKLLSEKSVELEKGSVWWNNNEQWVYRDRENDLWLDSCSLCMRILLQVITHCDYLVPRRRWCSSLGLFHSSISISVYRQEDVYNIKFGSSLAHYRPAHSRACFISVLLQANEQVSIYLTIAAAEKSWINLV